MRRYALRHREPPWVSIVAGTLNEIENIQEFIDATEDTLEGSIPYEIIVVDDGSDDGTAEYLDERALLDSRLKVIRNGKRMGLVNSNLIGIRSAIGKYKIVMDSDMQHPPEIIPKIVRKLVEGNELVICSRYAEGGSVGRRNGLRGLISRVAAVMSREAVPSLKRSTDPVSGYFGFTKDLSLPECCPGMTYKTLLHLAAANAKTVPSEVPYSFGNRQNGKSKIVSDWRFILNYIFELVSLRRKYGAQMGTTSQVTSYGFKSAEQPIKKG